tara:strand:- start:1001 stop:1267 length:267 start_codon:yes stop_codon:yes gene_type:complete
MIVKLTKTINGQLTVESIYDPVFEMFLVRTTDQTAAATPNYMPETKWLHPFNDVTYVHRHGNLFELKEAERESPWTYENTSLSLLMTL